MLLDGSKNYIGSYDNRKDLFELKANVSQRRISIKDETFWCMLSTTFQSSLQIFFISSLVLMFVTVLQNSCYQAKETLVKEQIPGAPTKYTTLYMYFSTLKPDMWIKYI